MLTRHIATVAILLAPFVLSVVPAGAGEISIGLPGNGTTVVDLPEGQVVLGIEAVKKKVENLKGVDFTAAFVINENKLQISGTIDSGHLKGDDLSFKSDAVLARDFEITDDTRSVTLVSGGKVSVKVKKSSFEELSLENVEVQVEATFPPGRGTLKLEGALDEGKYKDGDLRLKGVLTLVEPFVYRRGFLTVTISADKFRVDKKLVFHALAEDEDEILVAFLIDEDKEPFVVGSLWNGVDSPPLGPESHTRGELFFMVTCQLPGLKLYLHPGPVLLRMKEGVLLAFHLDGLPFSAEIDDDGETRRVEGEIDKGRYEDGVITIEDDELEKYGIDRVEIELSDDDGDQQTEDN